MKKIFFISIFIFTQNFLFSQNDEFQEESPQTMAIQKFGGAGGVVPMLGFFKNEEMNTILKNSNIPTLGTEPMYLLGGVGYAYIGFLPNVRIGGFGIGGKKTNPNVEYNISYSGFLMDYVVTVVPKLDIAAGFTFGGGGVNITLKKNTGTTRHWDNVWNDYKNDIPATYYTKNLNGSFFTFNPNLNIEYAILKWLQVRVGVGYPMMFSPTWKLDGKDEILGVPEKLKADGVTMSAGVIFGIFSY